MARVLGDTLSKIEKVSQKICRETLGILQELQDEDNDMVDEICEKYDYLTAEDALDWLRKTTVPLANDAELILAEIDEFSKAVIRGEEVLEERGGSYPFFLEVWCGDTYEKERIEGLKELLADLKCQLLEVTEEVIVFSTLAAMKEEVPPSE